MIVYARIDVGGGGTMFKKEMEREGAYVSIGHVNVKGHAARTGEVRGRVAGNCIWSFAFLSCPPVRRSGRVVV